jgi:CRP-like cAMP-binding protein
MHEFHSAGHAPPTPAQSRNKLLASLPQAEYQRILPLLRVVSFKHRLVLHKQGAAIVDVYFPGGGACSLTKTLDDGRTAEIATIGNEGLLGSGVFFGDPLSIGEAFVQAEGGEGYAMSVSAFITEMKRGEAFYNRVIRYSQAFTAQVMQTTVCNGLHSVAERCCRWLLMTRDCVMSDDLKLTQESLSDMLGVRRPTVTLVMQGLRDARLIAHTRGHVQVIDVPRLQEKSCECYAAVRAVFHRLLPELSQQSSTVGAMPILSLPLRGRS